MDRKWIMKAQKDVQWVQERMSKDEEALRLLLTTLELMAPKDFQDEFREAADRNDDEI